MNAFLSYSLVCVLWMFAALFGFLAFVAWDMSKPNISKVLSVEFDKGFLRKEPTYVYYLNLTLDQEKKMRHRVEVLRSEWVKLPSDGFIGLRTVCGRFTGHPYKVELEFLDETNETTYFRPVHTV